MARASARARKRTIAEPDEAAASGNLGREVPGDDETTVIRAITPAS